jgi:hypothetical protein
MGQRNPANLSKCQKNTTGAQGLAVLEAGEQFSQRAEIVLPVPLPP